MLRFERICLRTQPKHFHFYLTTIYWLAYICVLPIGTGHYASIDNKLKLGRKEVLLVTRCPWMVGEVGVEK